MERGDEVVLFDCGAGPNFMPGAGKLADSLAAAGTMRAFADLEILELNSHDNDLEEGAAHVGPSALIDLVATKPR